MKTTLASRTVVVLALTGSLYLVQNGTSPKVSQRASAPARLTSTEPAIGAAFNADPAHISINHQQPIRFGAIVNLPTANFIEITPYGELFTAKITGQAANSNFGARNIQRGLNDPELNELYQTAPGRLLFDVSHLKNTAIVNVSFNTGSLDTPGASLSKVDIRVGPETSAGLQTLLQQSSDEISLQATEDLDSAVVDLRLGGRLELNGGVTGEIRDSITADITVTDNSPAVIATVYQHFFRDRRFPGTKWELKKAGEYSLSDIESAGLRNIISSFSIEDGYTLRICRRSNLTQCTNLKGDVPSLARRYNDKIQSMSLTRDKE